MAYPSFNSGWPGAASTDTYVDLFKTAYADTIRLKTQNMDSVLSDTCVPEVLMGDPLVLDSYKAVSLHQRGRGQQYGVASTSVSGDTTGGLDSTGTALNDQPAFAADGDLGNIAYKVTGNERRELKPQFWEFAELFDPRDERGLMRAIQPDGTYVMNVAAAFNRKKDNVIIDAFRGPTTLYTNNAASSVLSAADSTAQDVYLQAFRKDVDVAYGGDGSSAKIPVGTNGGGADIVTGSAAGNAIVGTIGQLIEADTGISGESGCQQILVASQNLLGTTTASSRLHLAKILKGLEVMQTNGIPSGTKVYCAMSPAGVSELMAEAQYTSADFNALRPLQSGQPVDFLGVEFRVCPEITSQSVISTYTAGDDEFAIATGHYAYLYTDQAMVFGMGNDMSVRFDEIPERGYSLQCYHEFSLGAIRMDPKQMVIIPNHA